MAAPGIVHAAAPVGTEPTKQIKSLAGNEASSNDNLTSLMVPSTDTTISSKSAKNEIILMELETYSDLAASPQDDDDCSLFSSASSVSSVMSRYFERTDFLPWEDIYSNAPHVGFAMVAGGFACLHPLMFFAGALTAMGALRAAGATYDYATCKLSSSSAANNNNTSEEGGDELSKTPQNMTISCDWFNSAFGYNDDEADDIELVSPATVEAAPSLAKTASSCSTQASTVENLPEDDANNRREKSTIPQVATISSVPSVIQSPTTVQRQITDRGFDCAQWVKDHYPSLPNVALDNVEFKGLKAHEFFDVFFADDAPFGFPAFHKLRRDKEVEYGSWRVGLSPDNDMQLPSAVTAKERTVGYHAKTNSFLGPAYAPTKKVQRAFFVSKKMLVIDIRMTLQDIPFSKQFYLIERWVIDGTRSGSSPTKNSKKKTKKQTGFSSSHCVYLTVSSQVFFTQECAFESAITKESVKQVCEISKCWNLMAQDGLKRTEEARSKRLQKERMSSPLSQESAAPTNTLAGPYENDESIEIEHLGEFHNDRGTGRRKSSLLSRRSSFSQLPLQDTSQIQQQQRPLRSRSLSQTFSKLLVRGGTSNNSVSIDEHSESTCTAPPKVRISSAGVSSC